jgi:hypothetical protein
LQERDAARLAHGDDLGNSIERSLMNGVRSSNKVIALEIDLSRVLLNYRGADRRRVEQDRASNRGLSDALEARP